MEALDISDKQNHLSVVEKIIKENDFTIEDSDTGRPWGAFFRLQNSDAEKFIDTYFADIKNDFKTFEDFQKSNMLLFYFIFWKIC